MAFIDAQSPEMDGVRQKEKREQVRALQSGVPPHSKGAELMVRLRDSFCTVHHHSARIHGQQNSFGGAVEDRHGFP